MISFTQIAVTGPFLLLLISSIIISIKTRFIQVRAIPRMFSNLWHSFFDKKVSQHTIKAHQALFTAMSTTIGITNIVGPLVAIGFGGPGSLLGYFFATIFGAAATFAEVTFAQTYTDPAPVSKRTGGPQHYMNQVLPPFFGWLYTMAGAILLIFWSGSQSNAIAVILEPYAIPRPLTGFALACITIFVLTGGIKRVSRVAEKMVPVMFILYTSAMLWILGCNLGKLPGVFALIINSAFSTDAAGGFAIGTLVHSMRWGLARGYQSNESGIGTATVPHSMAHAKNPIDQGILSIVSVFSNGILCLLSGLAVLVTDLHLEYGTASITIITKLFGMYFPYVGPFILLICALLFAISTLLGNGLNGAHFFTYALGKHGLYVYYGCCAVSIFAHSMLSVDFAWSFIDILALPVIVPHTIALLMLAFTHGHVLDDRQ